MDLFLQIALSFPTLVFSVLLAVAVVYWLLAVMGLFNLEVPLMPEGEASEIGGIPALLARLRLDGVPLPLILSVLSLLAWLGCYFTDYFLLRHLPADTLRWLFGAGTVIGAFVVATPLTGLILAPLRGLFAKLPAVDSVSLLGRVAIVRSPEVTLAQGQAEVDDGGAGLILHVRAEPGQFRRGDRVVLVDYLAAQNAYRVIADRAAASGSVP